MPKTTSAVHYIDPNQASIWLEKRYAHQREISQDQVHSLSKAMVENTFSPVSVIMFSVLGGEMHLINGQQTMQAIIKSGVPQTLPVMFYEVENEEEEAKLYFHIDRQRRRNFKDSVRAVGLVDRTGMTPTMISKTAAALRYARSCFGERHDIDVSDDDMLTWIPAWQWETNAIWACISPCLTRDRATILTSPVLSVALITTRYQPDSSREFWRQVAQDDGLDRHDPRKILRNWLITVRGNTNRIGTQVSKPSISRGCIFAWNAWFSHKTLRSISVGNKSGPPEILGTAYSGNQPNNFLPLHASPNIETKRKDENELILSIPKKR